MNYINIVLTTLSLSLTLFTGCNVEKHNTVVEKTSETIIDVHAPKAKDLISANEVTPLDVRTPEEIADGKIEGAVELDFYHDNFKKKLAQLDKNDTYLVYCYSGNRSRQAAEMMLDMGFKNIYNALVGYKDLK